MNNITKTALALVVSLTAGYGVYTSQQKSELSELALANIEALAQNEPSGGYTKSTGQCPDPMYYKRWVSCKKGGTEECYPSDC